MATIETIRIASIGAAPSRSTTVRSLPAAAGRNLLAWIEKRAERRRSRLALLEMTDDQLKDIGLSRADAYFEGKRQLWD